MASLFPISAKARLLELTTVLEILAPTPDLVSEASDTFEVAFTEAKRSRAALGSDHPKLRDVDRLLSRIGNLRTESIKESLRIWTRATCTRWQGRDADQAAADVSRHRDVRSTLVHTGSASDSEIRAALQWLTEFVPAVLAFLIKEAATAA